MKRLLTAALLLSLCNIAFAGYQPSGYGLSYGQGEPNNLRGVRGSLQWLWTKHVDLGKSFRLGGYWDASLAFWRNNGNAANNHKRLMAIAAAPVVRLLYQPGSIHPYVEVSVGGAFLDHTKAGHRNLGSHWHFQDMLGGGFTFGPKQHYDLSLHYLHYSNANIVPPNHGIDVKWLVSFKYSLGYLP